MKIIYQSEYFNVEQEELQPGRKTHAYIIVNRRSGAAIGTIKWQGAWRQFCFLPFSNTMWSCGCLSDVNEAIRKIRTMYKEGKKIKSISLRGDNHEAARASGT